jgi:hypothetical protein
MPVPQPNPNETQDDFVSRCMGDKAMVKDFEQQQRAAVCYRTWKDRHKQQAKSAIDQFRDVLRTAAGSFGR